MTRSLWEDLGNGYVTRKPKKKKTSVQVIPVSADQTAEIPLSLNLGTPVVISEPKSGVAKQLQQLAQLYAPVDAPVARKGWRR